MALIDCPECGKQVAEKAPTCPHCGLKYPGGAPDHASIWLTLVVLVLLIGASGAWYWSGPLAESRKQRQIEACAANANDFLEVESCLMLQYDWNQDDALSAALEKAIEWRHARKQQERSR